MLLGYKFCGLEFKCCTLSCVYDNKISIRNCILIKNYVLYYINVIRQLNLFIKN